ncbi:MAG: ABC transporter ATP-binding protein [Mycoplasmataceae bacterium]|nr:ABC transporter ATP-binding protein [Mycoplasmataceae bacterium]
MPVIFFSIFLIILFATRVVDPSPFKYFILVKNVSRNEYLWWRFFTVSIISIISTFIILLVFNILQIAFWSDCNHLGVFKHGINPSLYVTIFVFIIAASLFNATIQNFWPKIYYPFNILLAIFVFGTLLLFPSIWPCTNTTTTNMHKITHNIIMYTALVPNVVNVIYIVVAIVTLIIYSKIHRRPKALEQQVEDGALVANKLCVSIKNKLILDNLTFKIPYGKFCCLCGPNGIGKTTFYKSLFNFIPIQNGNVFVNGIDNVNKDFKKWISYVPTEYINLNMNAQSFLIEMGMYLGMTKNESIVKINNLILAFNLPKTILSKKLTDLSTGENKLINIIQAILTDPKMLILDEPTENLDYLQRVRFYNLINKIRAENKNMTILISSHNLDEVEKYVDYAILLKTKSNVTQIFDKLSGSQLLQLYQENYV